MKKINKNSFWFWCLVAIVVGGVIAILTRVLPTPLQADAYAQAVIAFNYEGIEKGEYPNGSCFHMDDIKNDEVLAAALETCGLTADSMDKLRDNLSVSSIVPEDAADRVTDVVVIDLENAGTKEKVLDNNYYPSQYVVKLDNDAAWSSAMNTQLLNAVVESYTTWFKDRYSNAGIFEQILNMSDYGAYEYSDAVVVVRNQISSMRQYLGELNKEASYFRSEETGYTFADVSNEFQLLNDNRVNILASFIRSNCVAKDKAKQVEYYEFRLTRLNIDRAELVERIDALERQIANYAKDPVVIISSQESTEQVYMAGDYYDQLVKNKIALSEQLANCDSDITECQDMIDIFKSGSRAVAADAEYVEQEFASIQESMKAYAELAETVAHEYYEKEVVGDAVKVATPVRYRGRLALTGLVKSCIKYCGLCLVLVCLVWSIKGVRKQFFGYVEKTEEDKKEDK